MNFSKRAWTKVVNQLSKHERFDDIIQNLNIDNDKYRDLMKKMLIQAGAKTLGPALSSLMEEDDITLDFAKTKPSDTANYLGIEIECFSRLTTEQVQMLLIDMNMETWVEVGYDGSVEPPYNHNPYELRVLIKEKQLKSKMTKLGKFLKKGKFKANDSCGLHVHIDMRNRDKKQVFDNLIKFQDLMFAMVSDDRQYNDQYCAYLTSQNMYSRFTAINTRSYSKHKTYEVRLHQGTTDVKQMMNWINLLLKMVNVRQFPSIKLNNKQSVLGWIGKNPSLKSYINKNFDSNWKRPEEWAAIPSFNDLVHLR